MNASADALEALLGGTQCGQCGYDGCRPYAEALARGEAGPERCAPGGAPTARALAVLLGRPFSPPAPPRGEIAPRAVAEVIPELCVGCLRCLEACPADAIAGAAGRLHYVLAAHCTGCGLCLPACPVDCIRLGRAESEENWAWRETHAPEANPRRWFAHLARASAARARHEARHERHGRAERRARERRRTAGALAAGAASGENDGFPRDPATTPAPPV